MGRRTLTGITAKALTLIAAKLCSKLLRPAYKTPLVIVDRWIVGFTDRLAHTQCFPTNGPDKVKQLAGISCNGGLFHLRSSFKPSDLAISTQACIEFTSRCELCFDFCPWRLCLCFQCVNWLSDFKYIWGESGKLTFGKYQKIVFNCIKRRALYIKFATLLCHAIFSSSCWFVFVLSAL